VQACADDPQVAFHAIHVLSRIADGIAVLRWTQPGFGRTSSTSRSQVTPRNPMGFKDDTDNIRAEDTTAIKTSCGFSAPMGRIGWSAGRM
jgi:deferrochelatase/peroxidase EfeB